MPDGPATGPRGLTIEPFRAVTFTAPGSPEGLGVLTSPPYDVIDEAQRTALEAQHPHNAVRLILPRDGARPNDRYVRAAALLEEWLTDGVLRQPDTASLLIYEIIDAGRATRGLLAGVGLTQPDEGAILPHEDTMPGPVADRLALTEATEANLEPIMLVYDGTGGPTRDVLSHEPAPDALLALARIGTATHRVWTLAPAAAATVVDDLSQRRAVIADGHHRYATSLAYQSERRGAGAGSGPWDATLAWIVDGGAWGPRVEAIHRVLPTLTFDRAVELAGSLLRVDPLQVPAADSDAQARHVVGVLASQPVAAFVITDGERWFLVSGFHEPGTAPVVRDALPSDRSAAWRDLDVTLAHRFLFTRVWGVPDTEATIWYRHEVSDAVTGARESGGTAVLLRPTAVEQVAAVAAAGERMPRKSTLFLPKPRTGLVFRLLR